MNGNKDDYIPWWVPSLGELEKQRVCEVIDSNFINDGEYTTQLENGIAEICNVPYAVGVTSGTMAIFMGLAALGIGHGDEVIIPDITFIATANAVTLTGAKPVLVDVCLDDFNIDPVCVENAITPQTKAIIPVHISGRPADMSALLQIARKHNLFVVEDAAEALGSHAEGKPLGAFGQVGCFSFSPNKTITTGQGGMVVTRDKELWHRMHELKDQGRPVRGTGGADEHLSVGYNLKLTNVQSAIGLAQLEHFQARREHLRHLYCLYRDGLADVPEVRLPRFDIDGGACPQWVDVIVNNRDSLCDYLQAHNIDSRKYWFPLHTQAPYQMTGEDLHNSVEVSAKGLWLPSAFSVSDADVLRVCETIREWSHISDSKGERQ